MFSPNLRIRGIWFAWYVVCLPLVCHSNVTSTSDINKCTLKPFNVSKYINSRGFHLSNEGYFQNKFTFIKYPRYHVTLFTYSIHKIMNHMRGEREIKKTPTTWRWIRNMKWHAWIHRLKVMITHHTIQKTIRVYRSITNSITTKPTRKKKKNLNCLVGAHVFADTAIQMKHTTKHLGCRPLSIHATIPLLNNNK